MKTSVTAAALTGAVLSSTAWAALPDTWKAGAKWQFEIQDPLKLPADTNTKLVPDADVWDIDLWHAYKDDTIIPALHARGKTVICYFNFGAVQPEDCDFTRWYNKNPDLNRWNGVWYGDANDGSQDKYCERYENFADDEVFNLMKQRIDDAAAIGCDGVDPDNIDIWTIKELGVSKDKVVAALKRMAAHTHSKTTTLGNKLMIGQKNAAPISEDLVADFDFAVLESCVAEDFCYDFVNYLAAGKPVADIEYPKSLGNPNDDKNGCNLRGVSSSDRAKVCKPLDDELALMSRVLKLNFDAYGLNGCTQFCEDTKAVITPPNPNSDKVCDYNFDGCPNDATLKENCCCGGC